MAGNINLTLLHRDFWLEYYELRVGRKLKIKEQQYGRLSFMEFTKGKFISMLVSVCVVVVYVIVICNRLESIKEYVSLTMWLPSEHLKLLIVMASLSPVIGLGIIWFYDTGKLDSSLVKFMGWFLLLLPLLLFVLHSGF